MIDELTHESIHTELLQQRFGWGKDTAINASQNNDRHQQRPNSILKRQPKVSQGEFVNLDFTLVLNPIDDGIEGQPQANMIPGMTPAQNTSVTEIPRAIL